MMSDLNYWLSIGKSLLKKDRFRIYSSPIVIEKSGDRLISGFVSTEDMDEEGEIILQKGIVGWEDFIQHGWINDNHSKSTSAIIGYPIDYSYVEDDKIKGWWCKGVILKGYPPADDIWNLIKSLEGTGRQLGFSIEGKVLRRNGNLIEKSLIRNVALTGVPVNPKCSVEILKSFTKGWCNNWQSDKCIKCDKECLSHQKRLKKALKVGHDRVAVSGGRTQVPEDLESDVRKTTYDDELYCYYCGMFYKDENKLRRHLLKHAYKAMQ